jgi:MHS family proline/betaine transporter-like MFS transporter
LVQNTGSQASPAMFLIFGAIISAATLFVMKDPTNAPLD